MKIKNSLIALSFFFLLGFTQANQVSSSTLSPFQNGTGVQGYLIQYPSSYLTALDQQETTNPSIPYVLSFMNGVYVPIPSVKIDTNLVRSENSSTDGYVYGFIMINGLITSDKIQAISNTGVTIIGYTTYHTEKAKIPFSSLNSLQNLSFVRWVGFSQQNQKFSPDVWNLINSDSNSSQSLPVFINLFDSGTPILEGELESLGANITGYDSGILAYTAYVPISDLLKIANYNPVLYIELIPPTISDLDQSGPDINADDTRGESYGGLGPYNGSGIKVGIIDAGYNSSHVDLPPLVNFNCGSLPCAQDNDSSAGLGHGTFVACALLGRGTASNGKYAGSAPGVTNVVFADWAGLNGNGNGLVNSTQWMSYLSPGPAVVSVSASTGIAEQYCGSDGITRAFDNSVYTTNTTYVIAGNDIGPTGFYNHFYTLNESPGCAKNVITVGAIYGYGSSTIDQIAGFSSRGPTPEGLTKPDVVAPGENINSCNATISSTAYSVDSGTSFAAPQVSGVIATLMEHYSWLKGNPALVKALLMATAIPFDSTLIPPLNNDSAPGNPTSNDSFFNTYGAGKVDSHIANWVNNISSGYAWQYGENLTVSQSNGAYYQMYVPVNSSRLVVALAWTEPEASAGSTQATFNEIQLVADPTNDVSAGQCDVDSNGTTAGESSLLVTDTKQYLAINNPSPGEWTIKICPVVVNSSYIPQPIGVVWNVIRGPLNPTVNPVESFNVTSVYRNGEFNAWVIPQPSGYASSGMITSITGEDSALMNVTRLDGVSDLYYGAGNTSIDLGDYVEGASYRSVNWTLLAPSSPGVYPITVTVAPSNSNGATYSSTEDISVLNQPPVISVTQPSSNVNVTTNYTVQWSASNPEGDTLNISCYGDTGNTSYNPVETCFSSVSNSGSDSCNTTTWPTGNYYIWCAASDPYNTTENYSVGQLLVSTNSIFTLSLASGWNFLSFPFLPSNVSVSNLLTPINSSFVKIQTYNATSGNWLTFDSSVPSTFDSLANLSVGSGYWLYVNQSSMLNVSGNQPASIILQLNPGWNMVSWPYASANVSGALSSISGSFQKVQAYNASSGSWLTYDASVGQSFDTLANLTPGVGYWLYVNQSSLLTMN